MKLIYDGNYIVGGAENFRVSPNFRLKELRRKNGTVKVHRELVSAIQVLRDLFGEAVSVRSMAPKDGLGTGAAGLFAWLGAKDLSGLAGLADSLIAGGIFRDVRHVGDTLYVNIGDPDALPPIGAEDALQTAVQVTAGFETAGDPFQQVTGNFDRAGLSFGPSQFNFASGTLVPLFNKFIEAEDEALRRCFVLERHYDEWIALLGMARDEQVRWADERSKEPRKAELAQPWKGYLMAVGRVQEFRRIMTDHAVEKYGLKLSKALQWLGELVDIRVDRLNCICSLYDLCTQQGSLNRAHSAIRGRVKAELPDGQTELVQIAVEERAKKANPPWRADCLSRRLGILYRQRTPAALGTEKASRDNRNYYLLRDTRIKNPEALSSRPQGLHIILPLI